MAGLLAALLILDRWVLPEGRSARDLDRQTVSYALAVREATPSVVNIYTAKLVTSKRSPLLDDLLLRRFSQPQAQRQRIERSLGSGANSS